MLRHSMDLVFVRCNSGAVWLSPGRYRNDCALSSIRAVFSFSLCGFAQMIGCCVSVKAV